MFLPGVCSLCGDLWNSMLNDLSAFLYEVILQQKKKSLEKNMAGPNVCSISAKWCISTLSFSLWSHPLE